LRDLARSEGDTQALEGPLRDYHRLRVGPYRIVFQYSTPKTIDCVFAETRGIVYEIFAEAMLDILAGIEADEDAGD